MFDEKSDTEAGIQTIGLLTNKNDKTIGSISWPEFNDDIQKITIDTAKTTRKGSTSGLAVHDEVPTASKHAKKFENTLNTRSKKN